MGALSLTCPQPLVPSVSLRAHGPCLQTTCSRSPGQYFSSPAPAVCISAGKQIRWDSLKYTLNETAASNLGNILTSHLCFYITFLISPSVFLFPPFLSSSSFSSSILLIILLQVFPNVISAILKASEHFQKSLVHLLVIPP